jgi:hypothetical protein
MTRVPGACCGALIALVAGVWHAAAQDGAREPRKRPDMGRGIAPSKPLNTLQDLYDAFAACWRAPGRHDFRSGMEITVMFTLTRDGNILGEPRFTFVSREVPANVRAIYQRSMVDALKTCTPFPLTPEFGGAIAGRPQRLRFIDTRGQQRTDHGRSRKHAEA